jgi:hypothetical protein
MFTKIEGELNEVRTSISKVNAKVDALSTRVGHLEERSNAQDDSFARQELINLEAETFKNETKMEDLVTSIKELPGRIQISSPQVDVDGQISLDLFVDQQNEVTAEHGKTLIGQAGRMNLMDDHVNEEIVRVMNWVDEQKKDKLIR